MTSRITLDLRKEAHRVAVRIGSKDTRALGTVQSNNSSVMFHHTTQDPSHSLEVVTMELPGKALMDWSHEQQPTENGEEGQSPTRPGPTRWLTSNGIGASTSKVDPERGRGLGGSASMSRLDTEYTRKEVEQEWIEMGMSSPPP